MFWHQHLRSKLSSTSDFLTYQVLKLKKGSFITRYTNIFLSFFISGVVHCLTVLAAGFTFQQSCGAFKYFCAQVLGIMIEDGAQAAYRRVYGLSRNSQKQPRLVSRLVGYTWVALFLIWSTPAFIYPMLAANKGGKKDQVLPFSLLSYTEIPNTNTTG